MNSKKFKKEIWNYTKITLNNNNIIFYINNIYESFKRILNKKYIGYSKIMHNFKIYIYDIIKIYETHTSYKDKQNSITRALEHYVRINNHYNLITDLEIIKIKKIYKEFLINNSLPKDESYKKKMIMIK